MIRQVPWSEVPQRDVEPRPRPRSADRPAPGDRQTEDLRRRASDLIGRVQEAVVLVRIGQPGEVPG
jgi:hypothetical protein